HEALDRLVRTAVFGEPELREAARAALLEQARSAGVYPASIHEVYLARGRGQAPSDFTVPAINIRGLAYDTARALFRAQRALDAGAVICEIARSEIAYTDQRPAEYVCVVLAARGRLAPGKPGISKISIQTGTSHGGVPLPDGSIAQVKIDFDALQRCSTIAREKYRMGGAVQHGASTLPGELFDRFPTLGACEIHLATEFQNMIYEHPRFPAELKRAIYDRLRTAAADERKASDTDEQFFYKTRKKALGMFKRELWDLPAEVRTAIGRSLEDKFTFLLTKLGASGTRSMAAELSPFVPGAFP